ncbi:MAG TPA: class I SAM-dependent methyltransferase [Polyangiaceae bacterium]|jgi:SAM-dependent methyltransferase
MTAAQDVLNRSTWSNRSSRKWLDATRDFTDVGERVALELVRGEVRAKPILDLGVGTGRTIPMLAPLTDEYVAVDYLPEMVETSRERFPHVRVELGDARSLDGHASGHYGLVHFSFNGIDAVDHEGRTRILSEMRRVVRDDGVAVFSTLNIEGPAYRERPWIPQAATNCSLPRAAVRTARAWAAVPLDLARWMRIRSQGAHGPGWSVAPLSAHHYGVLAHFATLARTFEELEDARLDRDVIVLENEHGRCVQPGDDTSGAAWFHVVARPRL